MRRIDNEERERVLDLLSHRQIVDRDLVLASKFVREELGFILHNDKLHYCTLRRIRNRVTADKYELSHIPYFMERNGQLICQYEMDDVECDLISLLHDIYQNRGCLELDSSENISLAFEKTTSLLTAIQARKLKELFQKLGLDKA